MSSETRNTLDLRTPEGVTFSFLLAGPIVRFLAWGIDVATVATVVFAVGTILGLLQMISPGWAMAGSIIANFVVRIGYGIVLEWYWRGQTLGKRVLRLRVMDERALRLQFSQIAIRNLLRFVDALPVFYLVGGLACLLSRRAQRLGDFAAGTVVVRVSKIAEPDVSRVLTGKYSSFRMYPHIEARLRRGVSPDVATLAFQALLRRDLLDPQARLELFRELAEHFRTVAPFPDDATFGLTDEQYVRNAVDALFRKQGPSA